jgi:sulfatase maturation enzyme AslB (radical SAM superfamily)
MASGADEPSLELTGGEPLLAAGLVRRCIEYVRSRSAAERPVRIVVATNGLLLTPSLLDYFEERGVALRISADGVAEAHELRAPGTFSRLDELLDFLRTAHPDLLRKRVSIGVTLVAGAVLHFAASVRYLADKGIPSIRAYPKMTPDLDWTPGHFAELEHQANNIVDFSVTRWQETGDVPVEFLRERPAPSGEPESGFVCGGPRGKGFCVDPDGHAWACPLLAASLRRLPPKALELSSVVDLGGALDRNFARRLAELPERGRGQPLFTDKTGRYSSYGRCPECAFEDGCFVCPASLCNNQHSDDANRVPEALCAFNRATLKARNEFHRRIGAGGEAARAEEVAEGLKRLTDALMRAEASSKPAAHGRNHE